MGKKSVVWFEEVDKDDISWVGGKGANLGEMINAKFPIPYGFIITANAYFEFLEAGGIRKKIIQILKTVNYDNPNELQQASKNIQDLILKTNLPLNLAKKILHFYETLSWKEAQWYKSEKKSIIKKIMKIRSLYKLPLVAIRSSATAEDLPSASFAGQQETYLNVRGENHLLKRVKDCFASLFTERAIYYRHHHGFDHDQVGLAVIVQKMIESEKSGIAFSIDPVTNNKNKIVIEAIFGLGEYIVQGKVTPDHYEIDKRSFVILKKEINYQPKKLTKANVENKEVSLKKEEGKKQKLTNEEIIKLSLLVLEIEKFYYFPQDIEWAIEDDQIYIVQSRPVTTLKDAKNDTGKKLFLTEKPLLTGLPASPGIAFGYAKIILSPRDIEKVKNGDVLVAPATNPDYVPAMRKAAAIVTERGGRTSHAAIVSRELGVPAVVGAEGATKVIKSESLITVNGNTGEIFLGKVLPTSSKKTSSNKKLITATKVYVNLGEPDQIKEVVRKHVDGVGLLRAEFVIADLGIHPKEFIKEKNENLFVNHLKKELRKFVAAFSPRPVIYRATDFKTNEYRNLLGGKEFEPMEENPMLGFRGAFRYISNPEVFELELNAIRKIWEDGFRNLHLMIPFIRTNWELIKVKSIVEKAGLFRYPEFKFWIMVEVPSIALNIEEFLKIGVDGVSIGTNDLTMLILGVDRDNEAVTSIYDERTPIVLSVIEYVIKTCKKYGVTSSICGQAPSDYPEIIERLVRAGITSISVSPDAIERTREFIFEAEKKLLEKKNPH
ncbi:MAG: phosphoenolpyruvate synthase [Patescibacteria group bacterium]|nr:phosphoenolpyruvate synthase [Patescibacteria group bacterium]